METTPIKLEIVGFMESLNKSIKIKCSKDFDLIEAFKFINGTGSYLQLDNIHAIYGFGSAFKELKYEQSIEEGIKFLWWSTPDVVTMVPVVPHDIDLFVVLKGKEKLPFNTQFFPLYKVIKQIEYEGVSYHKVKDGGYHIFFTDITNLCGNSEWDHNFVSNISKEAVLLCGEPIEGFSDKTVGVY